MRLRGVRKSSNVEIRRGGGRRAAGVGGLGLTGVLLVLGLSWITGVDFTSLLSGQSVPVSQQQAAPTEAEQRAADFTSRVLATTEDVWTARFPEEVGRPYDPPRLVIFSGVTQSGCGGASGATGPFYCPLDETAYLDTQFFALMSQRLGAGGDFAAAYVVAHEVAHHVQNELGILGQVNEMRQRSSQVDANGLTVRLELQADCLSGVWARSVEGLMERGDLDEALNAARQIGDDVLQRRAGRVPQPHTFTHGTAEQRSRWFNRGFEEGRMAACDTFGTDRL
ncbi:neutral zinc metallopeptidase [Lutimaribacter marinistellae]|uniref:Neutral zinc metallopeptidase n=1 Tax=Lutimaribacter marinistellae TaxID=1820329 RepID=A0ABV7TDC3_9RHOB